MLPFAWVPELSMLTRVVFPPPAPLLVATPLATSTIKAVNSNNRPVYLIVLPYTFLLEGRPGRGPCPLGQETAPPKRRAA